MAAGVGYYKGEQGCFNVGEYVTMQSSYLVRLRSSAASYCRGYDDFGELTCAPKQPVICLIMGKVVVQNEPPPKEWLETHGRKVPETVREMYARTMEAPSIWILLYNVLTAEGLAGWVTGYYLSPIGPLRQDAWIKLSPERRPKVYSARKMGWIT